MSAFSFKDTIKNDIKEVFLNSDEFSDLHTFVIDNDVIKINAQVDSNELIKRDTQSERNKYADGFYKNQVIVYVNSEEFGKKPKQGAEIKMDGKKFIVIEVADEYGIYSITLETKRG